VAWSWSPVRVTTQRSHPMISPILTGANVHPGIRYPEPQTEYRRGLLDRPVNSDGDTLAKLRQIPRLWRYALSLVPFQVDEMKVQDVMDAIMFEYGAEHLRGDSYALEVSALLRLANYTRFCLEGDGMQVARSTLFVPAYEHRYESGFFAVGPEGEASLRDIGAAILKRTGVLFKLPDDVPPREWDLLRPGPMLTRGRAKVLAAARAWETWP
jgi:hypothetical protein